MTFFAHPVSVSSAYRGFLTAVDHVQRAVVRSDVYGVESANCEPQGGGRLSDRGGHAVAWV